jgi:hypothetical protein
MDLFSSGEPFHRKVFSVVGDAMGEQILLKAR